MSEKKTPIRKTPKFVLSNDFIEDTVLDSGLSPEERLVVAVMGRAIKDYLDVYSQQTHHQATPPLEIGLREEFYANAKEARYWIFANGKSKEPWTLNWCCEVLGKDPNVLRENLKKYSSGEIKSVKNNKLKYGI